MMTLIQNVNYEATITLSGLNILGSNNQVKEEFEKVGFANVQVSGSGKHRRCTGTWAKATIETEIPVKSGVKISDVKQI